MSPSSLSQKLRSWLDSSPRAIPVLMTVTSYALAAPRPRRPAVLTVLPALLGLAALGALGWKAARLPVAKARAPGRSQAPFAFTWQMTMTEEVSASAASGH